MNLLREIRVLPSNLLLIFVSMSLLACGHEARTHAHRDTHRHQGSNAPGERTEMSDQHCGLCGMAIEPQAVIAVRAELSGQAQFFDSVKCYFTWRAENEAERASATATAIEYYSQTFRPAADLYYVLGSDVEGAMGADLVPIADQASAERFMREHHGSRVLRFGEITPAVVGALMH